jgi:hypothetical protein
MKSTTDSPRLCCDVVYAAMWKDARADLLLREKRDGRGDPNPKLKVCRRLTLTSETEAGEKTAERPRGHVVIQAGLLG